MLEMFNRDMLKDPPNLDDIISVAPCARTVAAARRMAADKIDTSYNGRRGGSGARGSRGRAGGQVGHDR